MALIPPDAGIRMRMQTEASLLQPTAPVRGIPSDLPELRIGQTFTALIQDVLPENTYRALVAGKQLTLQLPEGAKTGDSLELVVIDRTPKTLIAQLAGEPGAAAKAAAEPYPYATLSRTGQMIGQLLLPEGEQPQPAPLNRGQPLLAQPPANALELTPALEKSVTQSGLFYESHQAQWVTGRLPMEQLLQEPQGRLSAPATLSQHGISLDEPDGANHPISTSPHASVPPNLTQTLRGGVEHGERPETPQSAGLIATAGPAVPEEIRPLVQQQLDAAATQRLIWHGEVWPQQAMEWEIIGESEDGATAAGEDEMAWRTTLRLQTPRLGQIDASLRLTATGLQITVTSPYGASAADLRDEMPVLAASLEAAGIKLLSFQVKHESE